MTGPVGALMSASIMAARASRYVLRPALPTRALCLGLVSLVAAVACGGATTPGPSPSPAASPGLDACGRPASRDWTTERGYGGGVVPRGDALEIGLVGRRGASIRATVSAPDGSGLMTTTFREGYTGSTAHYVVRYPSGFTPAGPTAAVGLTTPGTYTVLWDVDGAPVACDRFEVARTGADDARPCAPAGWSVAPPGRSLSISSGVATMSISGAPALLGIAEDPWYAFQPAERRALALPDGSATTLYVSESASPRRVSARFRAGPVPYRFDASGEDAADLADRSREVIVCAQQRLQGGP